MDIKCSCMNDSVSMEILMLILGAALGFLASLFTMIIQRVLREKGKLNIFYRFSYQKGVNGETWGFEETPNGGKCFVIPIVFEFQNTSNTTRVIRDVSMHLYDGKKFVAKMKQMDYLHITHRKGNSVSGEEDHYFGTDKGSYSFVIPPRSIQRQECEYMYIINASEISANKFDRIKACYFDEKNKTRYFEIRTIDNCWEHKMYPIDEDWQVFK